MASFAERIGKRSVRSITQIEDLDDDTRTELWNTLVTTRELLSQANEKSRWQSETSSQYATAMWSWVFNEPRDEMGGEARVWARIKSVIRAGEWFDALNVIEETVKYLIRYQDSWTNNIGEVLADAFNDRFETYLVGYRFIGKELTPVDTTLQSDTIQAAIASTGSLAGVRHSLERATELLADRIKPDYPNSIKESISAVEALVKVMTGKGELSKGLSQLEDSGVVLHPALKAAWIKMYGWTSDADGIRHGGIDAASADQALAKYILVTCSAFVSYLIETGRKAGIPLD